MRLAALLLAFAIALPAAAFSNPGEVRSAELPPEARAMLALIRNGGPFSYPKDGAPFGNREQLLPKRPRGYYREYTVKTPASRDRGARRIVAGQGGEFYYSNDHYRSFRRILE
jgi:ribonuclease T1